MSTHDPIAYTFEADYHCPACTEERFGRSETGFIAGESTDSEGNAVGVMFSWGVDSDHVESGVYCGDCGAEIVEPEESTGYNGNTEAVLQAYVECALWSSTDESGEPLDAVYGPDDLSAEALDEMREDVGNFLAGARTADLDQLDAGRIGHDFWLTRNGHGAGFWDRGIGEAGERLTAEAHTYGSSDLYVGDDGLIHVA